MKNILLTTLTFMFGLKAICAPGEGNKDHTNTLEIKKLHVTDVRCNGQKNGGVTALLNGGKAPYYYSMNGTTYQTDPHFNGLKAGEYKIYVKDAANNRATTTFNVNEPAKIHFLPAKYTHASCCYSDGAVLVKAVGGVGKIMYSLNESPQQASGYFKDLSGGYTVVAKDSLGCNAAQIVAISDFNGPVIDFINSTDVSCYGGENGTITLVAMGGSGELQYSLNGGKTYQTDPSFKHLAAGKYTARVKDESGCLDSNTIVISEPPVLEVKAVSSCMPGVMQKNEVFIEYSIGGTGVHTYSMNNKDFQEVRDFKQVAAGEYTVYVKDAAGCVGKTNLVCGPRISSLNNN